MSVSLRAASCAALILLAACGKAPPPPEPIRAVRTVTVGAEVANAQLEFAAEVRARTESRLGFRVSGKMVQRSAEIGQRVRAGTALAQLDPQDLRLAQSAAKAATQAAQVNVELAEADLKRFRDLHAQGFVSAIEIDRRESALKAAQATLEQALAQAGVQSNQAAYTTLVATVNGVVTGIEAEPGAVLAAGMPVVRLAHDGPRDAVFAVPEDQVALVRGLLGKEGAMKVRLWGSRDALPATVREVAASADSATRTFQVKVDIGAVDAQLGQTAVVLMDLPSRAGVTKVPLTAVTQQDGKTAVWLVDKATMTVKPQPITVGGAEGNAVVVQEGLQPGDIVVTAGVHTLTPGQKVKFFEGPLADVR